MKNISNLFNKFRFNEGAIWLEKEKINLSVPQIFQNQETKDFIRNNKSQIVSILKENQIFSLEKFLNTEIIKDRTINQYPLSPSQERLWFIEQYEEGTNAYHMPEVFELNASTDPKGIKYALQQIVSRHEVLRSTIEQGSNQEQSIQKVHDEPLSIEEAIVSANENYENVIQEDINRPFNLSVEYPIRVKFYTVQSNESTGEEKAHKTLLLINIHHIAGDGWSMEIFQKELFAYYKAYVSNDTDFSLPALEIQYKDYALWQSVFLTGEKLEKQLSYWKEKLSDYQTLKLPTDFTRPSKVDYKGDSFHFELDQALSIKLRTLAKDQGCTLYTVLLAGFYILLHKYAQQDDIVIGTPIANRDYRQTSNLIGFFTNTLVIREKIHPNFTVNELLKNLNNNILDGQKNQDLPFEKIVDELNVERDLSRHPVFQVLFRCHSFTNKQKEEELNQYLALQNISTTFTSKFDLHLLMEDSGNDLTGVIEYATSLFEQETIERLSKYYTRVLKQLVAKPNKAVKDYTLLSKEEYNQIVYQWNDTDKHYPKGKTMNQLFQEQAEKTPNSVALAYEGIELSYQQLNEKSNQLARQLRAQYQQRTKQALGPNTLIALYLDKSLEMIIAILAVLKAGGAYVPIDPSYPQERIDYLLKDTQTELILSQKHLIDGGEVQLPKQKVVCINLTATFYDTEETVNLPQYSKATDLAYVIYTSGTTGKPKGVMVEHHAFSQFIYNFCDFLSEKTDLKEYNLLCLTNYVFDIFGLEYALPLISGHQVTLSSIDKVKEGDFLGHQIIQQTPSSLLHLATNHSDQLSNIICLVGGEALSPAIADQLTQSFKKVFNVYGPAETVIWSSACEIENPEKPYIGKALFNEQLFVLDQSCNPVPIGVVGELYIGGASLARGYLNLRELTEERFIVNPFATEIDKTKGYARLYKTGDLVRWLPDGNLEYIGRNDDQIKIRGHRIELGEIEHALTRISGIKQSCVLAKDRKTKSENNKHLIGYYVLDMAYVSDNDSTILDNWEHLYNSEYDKVTGEIKMQSDFSIWLSYITGDPIPLSEMEEWKDDIVRLIKKLKLDNVLEIGIGSGLLMYPLLNEVKRFVGLDISQSAISRHQKYLKDKKQEVDLYHLRADQIDELTPDEFYDTIIINSVCQYFPSIHYFDEVVEKSIHKLSAGGSIFLGDIRNYDLHQNLIIEKLNHEEEAYTKQSVERLALKENELLISPDYFTNLKERYKQINVEIIKRGDDKYDNELSRYRYDVVLTAKGDVEINGQPKIGKNEAKLSSVKGATPLYNTPFLNQLSKEDIHDQLTTVLPSYMIPETFVALPSFPLTTNGKLDKRALPDPDFKESVKYIKPSTDLEIKLCEIYAGILGLPSDQIGTHENFFRMGGNSILSIQLRAKLNQLEEFKQMSVANLFKYNSINKLIQSIQNEDQTEYKLQKNPLGNDKHEVAIIGVSGAFSGASNIKELWSLIANQEEGIQFYSKEECKALEVDDALLEDPDFVRVAGKVKDIELFDPSFWEMSPNEAKQLDPQTRKFVEHCWFALESSGYAQQRKENNIGVFAGSGTNQYYYDHILYGEMAEQINIWEAANSNSKDALTTKAAFLLGLSGPANSINTACSTGLVSVVEACKNLQLGTCNMALAGGVSLSLPDQVGYVYEQGMIVSKDGHCRTFDQEASGTIAGSGVGIVLLKRLEEAIEDKDTILGVIKGFASNNDGDRKTGYTAPSVIGQSECIINAQKMAGIEANQIDYVECHGTGTHLGDPIEVQALRDAFEFNRSKEKQSQHKTVLGAIKANIGHTDSAAGTAGLIKVVSMLQNNLIPGQVNFNEPNAELNLGHGNFEIIKENREWPVKSNQQRLAGVSSFGIGGTNAHVIIGDYVNPNKNLPKKATSLDNQAPRYIIPLSAKSRPSLERYQQVLLEHLVKEKNNGTLNLANIAYTFEQRRAHFNHRTAYCVKSVEELIHKLGQDGSTAEVNTENENKVVFLFPGQGAQYAGIAKTLYDNDAFFKAIIDRCIAIANKYLEVDLYEVMYPEGIISRYDTNETRWAQISLFISEYALARLLESLGVKADAYLGHSIGEYVAATLSGVFSLDDAIKLVIARGNLMQSMQRGSMLAVNAKLLTILAIVKEHNCEIAVINSSEDIVVSGEDKAIQKLQETLEHQAIVSVKLKTSHAYHSVMMQQAADEFESLFKDIKLNKPTHDFVSNLTGEIATEEVTKANYWSEQLRNTVQFAEGIKHLSKKYNHQITFVEVGPGKSLSSFVRKHKNANSYRSIQTAQLLPSAKEAKAKQAAAFEVIASQEDLKARLWMNGLLPTINNKELFATTNLQIDLPSYQFQHKKYWIEKGSRRGSNDQLKLLPKEKWLSAPVWSAVSNLDKQSHKTKLKNALIFIREDQLSRFEFSTLAKESQLVILDFQYTTILDIKEGDLYRINPSNERHFDQLGKQLNAKNIVFDSIIHMASIENGSEIEEALHYSFYSLFLIRQQFLNSKGLASLFVLTNGLAQITNEDLIRPSNGTLVGAIRNINHEFTYLDARIIDIGNDLKHAQPYLVQAMNKIDYHKSEDLMAIRFGKLWIEKLEEISGTLPETKLIEDGDAILVTGGLGGIALATAQYISSKNKVKFILVSRRNIQTDKKQSDYTKQKIEIIESIKANGSTVSIHNLDLSKIKKVEALITEVEQSYGHIRGIIHAAGSPPLALFKYSLLGIKNNLKGKVYGIDNVMNCLDPEHLKFIASTSSLASIMGDINRIEYCASNSYLDYLAVDRLRFRDTKMISINWPGWSDIGMVREHQMNGKESEKSLKGLERLMDLNTITQQEGAELFYQLINQTSYGQVAISKLQLNQYKNKLFKQKHSEPLNRQISIVEKNYTEIEYKTAQIFCDLLGIEEISINDDFFRIGGNSISAIHISNRINKELGYEIKVADVFKFKSVTGILKNRKLKKVSEENVVVKF